MSSSARFVSQLDLLAEEVAELRAALEQLLLPAAQEAVNDLPAVEAAQLNVVLAFVSSGLFFACLKAQGVDPANHPVKAELERVRLYMKKVNAKVQQQQAQPRPFAVDKAVVQRIVKFTVGANDHSTSEEGELPETPEL